MTRTENVGDKKRPSGLIVILTIVEVLFCSVLAWFILNAYVYQRDIQILRQEFELFELWTVLPALALGCLLSWFVNQAAKVCD